MRGRGIYKAVWMLAAVCWTAGGGWAQTRSMEELNMRGSAATNPLFAETVLGVNSAIRTGLYRYGWLFRMTASGSYIQNTLREPVKASAQSYTGQREFAGGAVSPVLAWDLRQLGLEHAQFAVAATIQKASWNPAQPESVAFNSLYFYKEFSRDRVETKLGYVTTDSQFLGLQVGGQVASGAQGVYAVLPYEVGLAHSPIPAPAGTLKVQWGPGLYVKGALQRGEGPGGGVQALHRNPVGLRFLPAGDGLLEVGEAGLRRAASTGRPQEWLRAGYIHNATQYPSLKTGAKKGGNYCGYLLADRQLWQSDAGSPRRGLYAGGSAMVVPADLNTYRLYYEARVYAPAPFRGRPGDFASLVSSYTAFSQDKLRALGAAGKSFSRASDSVTGSYTLKVGRGAFVGMGLSYVNGPAVTPRTPAALTFTAQTNVFF